jgi:2-methylcitrate dehydratase PrpD
MSADQNTYATIPGALKTTAAAAEFVENVTFNEIPAEALRIGTRCLLDGLGLFVAGSEEHSVQILVEEAEQMGGRKDALLLSRRGTRVPAPRGRARARHGGSRA